jgi:hypothetical protein
MEMYRQHGVEEAIRAAGLPAERTGLIVWTESLAGADVWQRYTPEPIPSRARRRAGR